MLNHIILVVSKEYDTRVSYLSSHLIESDLPDIIDEFDTSYNVTVLVPKECEKYMEFLYECDEMYLSKTVPLF